MKHATQDSAPEAARPRHPARSLVYLIPVVETLLTLGALYWFSR